jgi:predicted SAM-dependent methyltransferase
MGMKLSRYAPQFLKQSGFYRRLNHERRVRRLRERLAGATPLNVVIGAGATEFPGWFNTDREVLDIVSPRDWAELFAVGSIDRLLAEHVLEHLSEEQCRIAVGECYRYLKQGGLFRVAVPDGYRRDPSYVVEATPPNDGHQALYNIDTLTTLLENTGFVVDPLEYFDAQEEFHAQPWDENEGHVQRSIRFDSQTAFQRDQMFYTSLIVDARKM